MEHHGKTKGKRDILPTDDHKQLLNSKCCEATMKGTGHLNNSFEFINTRKGAKFLSNNKQTNKKNAPNAQDEEVVLGNLVVFL